MAYTNTDSIPFTVLKTAFKSAVCIIEYEKWHLIALSHKKVKDWKGERVETHPYGKWESLTSKPFPNIQSAYDWAKRNCTQGHWKLKKFVPELHSYGHNVIEEF